MYSPQGEYRGVMGTEAHARGFGLLAMAMLAGDQKAATVFRSEFKDIATRAVGTDTQAGGGELVPIEYADRIQRLVETAGVFPANAFPMPMSSESLTFQRRKTGLTVYKTGQNTAATEADARPDGSRRHRWHEHGATSAGRPAGSQAGQITLAQKLSLLGGYEAQDVTGPLLQASSPQAIAAAQAEIRATTLTSLEARRGSSRYVQAADRGARRDLVDQLTLEQSFLAGTGESMQQTAAGLREKGGESWMVGAALHGQPTNSVEYIRRMVYGEASRPSGPTFNNSQQYNMGTDGESPLTRPNDDGLE